MELEHPTKPWARYASGSGICGESGNTPAKVRYKTKSGREKWAEAGYTRYSVIFTGEALPDGTQADAVYIILNPPYRELLNHVETRPLDYDYLKKLSPGPQRFYELLSFQIYGAIAGSRARAKMLYSDYCKYAPQVRYFDFDHVKKQMYKLHVPHRESAYVTKVDYKETSDPEGKADWEMFYTPGPKAFAEYRAFTNRQLPQLRDPEPRAVRVKLGQGRAVQETLALTACDSELLTELTRRGIADFKARELIANAQPGQEILDQLEYVDWLIAKDKKKKVENPPGLYIWHIRDNVAPPASFPSSRKTKLYQEAEAIKNDEQARKARLKIEYEEYVEAEVESFADALDPDEYKQLFEAKRAANRISFRSMNIEQLDRITHMTVRGDLLNAGRVHLLSIEDFFNAQTNPGLQRNSSDHRYR